ncbi:MAG: alpha/beta fold hydrolase [Deltaproteobacteria bacterium]
MPRSSFYPFKSESAKAEYEAYCAKVFETWPPGSETRLVETESGQTFARICGPATGPPLVLLSGARSGSLMWTEMIAALSAHHRCYALDTIGDAGLSVNRHDLKKPEDFVTWLDEVLPQLVPQGTANLMGISYGGFIAAQYALHRPERVGGAVLLAPGSTVLPISRSFMLRMALLAVPLPGMGLRAMFRWLFQDAARGDATARAGLDRAIEYLLMVVRLYALPRPPMPTVIDDEGWKNFRAPCLFMVGEHEKIYSAKAAVARLNRVAPQVRTEIIPGAGHDMTLVRPDLVMAKALTFLDAQAQAAA